MRKSKNNNTVGHQAGEPPSPLQGNGAKQRTDTLNSAIIARLEEDGRTPFSEIAQELNVSEGTIRNRVNSMKDSGLLRIVAIADPIASDYQSDAMLGITVAGGSSPESVAERLGEHRDVVYVLWVAGRYDLMVELVCENRDALLELLNDHIHNQKDIAEVDVMLGLKNFKNQFLLKREWERQTGPAPKDRTRIAPSRPDRR